MRWSAASASLSAAPPPGPVRFGVGDRSAQRRALTGCLFPDPISQPVVGCRTEGLDGRGGGVCPRRAVKGRAPA
eukprot:11207643-Lingulodinium_polyedra.AAC.1